MKRLRIFAGPNGSGKSTIYHKIISSNVGNFGVFINADDIESELRKTGKLNCILYSLHIEHDEFCNNFKESSFYALSNGHLILEHLQVVANIITIDNSEVINSYFAAFIADYFRIKMLECVDVFTIETVMSHNSKIDYIRTAKSKGYRIYLYFISTRDPQINVDRVSQRVHLNGHNVSEEKIRSRYKKSLENLYNAMVLSDRAYMFDNSSKDFPEFYAEYDGKQLFFHKEEVPNWIKNYLIDPATEAINK